MKPNWKMLIALFVAWAVLLAMNTVPQKLKQYHKDQMIKLQIKAVANMFQKTSKAELKKGIFINGGSAVMYTTPCVEGIKAEILTVRIRGSPTISKAGDLLKNGASIRCWTL